MKQIPLGRTGLTVSEYCLGTMTWGTQNTEAEAHEQIAHALDRGVNFWDTAEMYPTNPVSAETIGDTETIIGNWFARGGRDRVVLATKITGEGQKAVRDGAPITGATMRTAVEASLRRLKTDYIDLYQLHWPNRGSYHFRQMWRYAPQFQDPAEVRANMHEVLQAAADLVAEGKIRAIGLSNESVWGAANWLALAEAHGLPRMGAVQNEYSLLCRQFDTDWAEFSVLEDMPLLAFSPLACGLLSGKYAGGVIPDGSRRTRTPELGGRITERVFEAVSAYLGLARDHGLDPCQMALAFTRSRPFQTIPIIGATTMEQLATNIAAADLTLDADVLAGIDRIHRAFPAPF
ncbi:aldo/keto reductase [Aliigemmobacter aestuarii]|uniref:Aldo/keto reductase n=1 Tax=Aliigemmobacter aestuarii TaxID=1445661 RepID=A0A4V3V0N9_9RHOB|nr:aldo/keto reductase [Gemmobacter aestuarii]THD84702.1 aldo/keto reductase [Gemmobacter aestuarii]